MPHADESAPIPPGASQDVVTRAGIVAVVGRPNAGKSTLLNRVVGQKLAITSPRPQSTRRNVTGILMSGQTQIVFVDTPGLMNPAYHLQRAMRHEAIETLRDADAILHVVDATGEIERLGDLVPDLAVNAPVTVALNKIDRLTAEQVNQLLETLPDSIAVSALDGSGVSQLVQRLAQAMPESGFLYDPEDVSTQSLRFFAAEAIREAAFEQLEEELPYAVTAEIDEFREDRDPVYVRATVFVERESQKRILIGKGGSRIRELGQAARTKIEELIGSRVYLDLWIKVLHNWRRNPASLSRFGFSLPEDIR